YEPNLVARALATGKSNLIGVIVPNSSDPYYAEVIRAIDEAASAAGYHVLLSNGSYEMDLYDGRVRDMMSLHMRGIIAAPPFTSERPNLPPFWRELLEGDLQVVLVNRQLRPPVFHQVAADYMTGVRIVLEALAERGHRRVAYISGTPAMLPIRQRLAAFKRITAKLGLDRDESLLECCDLSYAGGAAATRRLWDANRHKPTAIVAFSDTVAVGILKFLHDSGVRVPEQVSIVSFDGTAVGEFTHKTLSTVITPIYEIGQQAFRLLVEAMDGQFAKPQSLILPVDLVLRESVGVCRS
ncbi:MAG: LacI family DNA-binding transcriptional regulator, partial [Acidobacteriota bacterium]